MAKKFKQVDSDRKSRSLSRSQRSESIDDLYTGMKVTKLPERFMVKIGPREMGSEIMDLDFETTKASLEALRTEKPRLSKQAWTRLSNKSRGKVAANQRPEGEGEMPDQTLKIAETSAKGGKERSSRKDRTPERHLIPLIREPSGESKGRQEGVDGRTHPGSPLSPNVQQFARISMVSTDSGLGDDPTQSDRETVSLGSVTENAPTTLVGSYPHAQSLSTHSSPSSPSSSLSHSLGASNVHLRLPNSRLPVNGYSSIRLGTKHHRKSMLLSELCVVTVSVPADTAQAQKGRGAQLKFRFSPYTQIEFLRVAILKVRRGIERALCFPCVPSGAAVST